MITYRGSKNLCRPIIVSRIKSKKSLSAYPASSKEVEQNVQMMVELYKKAHLITDDTAVRVRQFDRAALKNGRPHSVVLLESDVGADAIFMIDKERGGAISNSALQGGLAQELSRSAINQNPLINPHHIVFWVHELALAGAILGPLMASRGILRLAPLKVIKGLSYMFAGPALGYYCYKNGHGTSYYGKPTIEYNFEWIKRLVQIESDLIAAIYHPEGSGAIRAFLESEQKKDGDNTADSALSIGTRLAVLALFDRSKETIAQILKKSNVFAK